MKILPRRRRDTQNDFVSLAAHQLRTLPNIIGWEIESLLTKNQRLSIKDRRMLHQIADTNKRMITLIDTMLNISRIELGTVAVHPEDIDVVAYANEELAYLNHAHASRLPRIITKYPVKPVILHTDKSFLRVILQNLFSNAIKYTPPDGHIKVTVTNNAQYCRVEVTDTGCGIPLKERKQVFHKLFRAENVRRSPIPGNGLGLNLTKALVKQLHGKIGFTSVERKGTTFFIELPHQAIRKRDGTTTLAMNTTFEKGGQK